MSWAVYIWLILISGIVSTLVYSGKGFSLYLKIFSFYLLVTFFIDFIGGWRSDNGLPTVMLYNIYTTIQFVFLFWMLHCIIKGRRIKKILIHGLWLYPLLVFFNKLFLQDGQQFHSITYSLGGFLIVMITIIYFFELFQSDEPVNLIREPSFWICSGLLFYYACTFPLYALINFLQDPSNIIIKNLGSILAIVNILLYSSFIIAALCRIKTTKFLS